MAALSTGVTAATAAGDPLAEPSCALGDWSDRPHATCAVASRQQMHAAANRSASVVAHHPKWDLQVAKTLAC